MNNYKIKHKKDSSEILFIIFCVLLLIYLKFFAISPSPSAPSQSDIRPAPVKVMTDATDGTDSIPTDNYANKILYYYYYIPKTISENKTVRYPYLILVPGLSASGKALVTKPFKDFAKEEGFVIIAPTFIEDDENFDARKSYQYPDAWSGVALNNIVASFAKKQNIYPLTYYMLGFSAGAQFVSRYSMLYPDYVTACAINAAGTTNTPQRYQATKFYFAIGTQDSNDRKETAKKFYNEALAQSISVTYKEYPIAHELSENEINDELSFFRQIKNSIK